MMTNHDFFTLFHDEPRFNRPDQQRGYDLFLQLFSNDVSKGYVLIDLPGGMVTHHYGALSILLVAFPS